LRRIVPIEKLPPPNRKSGVEFTLALAQLLGEKIPVAEIGMPAGRVRRLALRCRGASQGKKERHPEGIASRTLGAFQQ
jgi:hypothetical protein